MGLAERYRVDTVPLWLRPLYWLYGYGLGFLLHLYILILHVSCRIEYIGGRSVDGPPYVVYCFWHDSWMSLIAAFPRMRRHVWLNHPYWYMKPIHVTAHLIGIGRLVLGSTGHQGREAAVRLVEELRRGYSTVFFVDGPQGPPHILKKGALHVSLQSGLPVVPLRMTTQRCLRMPSWDRRFLPLPFLTHIKVTFGQPMTVTAENFDAVAQELERSL